MVVQRHGTLIVIVRQGGNDEAKASPIRCCCAVPGNGDSTRHKSIPIKKIALRETGTYRAVLHPASRIRALQTSEMKKKFWRSVDVSGHSWPIFSRRKMRLGGGTITKYQPRWIRSSCKLISLANITFPNCRKYRRGRSNHNETDIPSRSCCPVPGNRDSARLRRLREGRDRSLASIAP